MTKECKKQKLCGVYGFPRGGLRLAVALSHSLQVPLLSEQLPASLVVDDVYKTGRTLNRVKDIRDITAYVWVSKVEPEWWSCVEVADPSEWFVFPWEDRHFAKADEENYRLN